MNFSRTDFLPPTTRFLREFCSQSSMTPASSLNDVNVTPSPYTPSWLIKEIQVPGWLLKAKQSGVFPPDLQVLRVPLLHLPGDLTVGAEAMK